MARTWNESCTKGFNDEQRKELEVIHIPASNDVSRPPTWGGEHRCPNPQRFQPTLDTFGETIADEAHVADEAPRQRTSQRVAVPARLPEPAPARELVPFASVLRRLA